MTAAAAPAEPMRAPSAADEPATDGRAFCDPMKSGGVGPEMIVAPAGAFRMGADESDALSFKSEWPRRTVEIEAPFALGRFQVSFDEFDRFADATGAERPYDFDWGRGRLPAIFVSWEDATAFCAWLSDETGAAYRLPSEAEWEYACRAGSDAPYMTGDAITSHEANFNGSELERDGAVCPNLERTQPVGAYPPNAWGYHDMHGNVGEWCDDCWRDDYAGASACAAPRRAEGDALGVSAVVRGGGWTSWPRYVRSSDRWHYARDSRFEMIGFRVARSL